MVHHALHAEPIIPEVSHRHFCVFFSHFCACMRIIYSLVHTLHVCLHMGVTLEDDRSLLFNGRSNNSSYETWVCLKICIFIHSNHGHFLWGISLFSDGFETLLFDKTIELTLPCSCFFGIPKAWAKQVIPTPHLVEIGQSQ